MHEQRTTTSDPTRTTGGELRIRLLGRFEVRVDGYMVADENWHGRHGKALLKLLALSSEHRLHRDVLMERLWPEAAAERSASNLTKALYMARHALEPSLRRGAASRFLLRDAELILLVPTLDVAVDISDFEARAELALDGGDPRRLEAAIALYGGELLPEDRFDPHFDFRREQLAQRHRALLTRLADIREANGELDAGIDAASRLLEHDPTCESVHRQLMRLFAMASQRARSLAQFEQCEALLRTELDAAPEAATFELRERIRSGSFKAVDSRASVQRESAVVPDEQAIAILPLVNAVANPAFDYLCDGIAENLIYHLSKSSTWRVIAWNTVLRCRAVDAPPVRIGSELGVSRVLIGRVSGEAHKLEIAYELIDAADGTLIRGDRCVGESGEALMLQMRMVDIVRDWLTESPMARTVAAVSTIAAGERNLPTTRREETTETDDVHAYHAYLKGRYHWNKRTASGLREALVHFADAIDHDPVYARAWSGLADSYNLQSLYSAAAPHETMPKARAAALQALAIDASLSEAYTSLAYCRLSYDWDLDAAEASFATALRLDPEYATARQWYHKLLVAAGRFDEAVRQIKLAKRLDPLSRMIATEEAWGLYHSRRYEDARSHLERVLDEAGVFPIAHYILALVHVQESRPKSAVEALSAAMVHEGNGTPFALGLGLLGYVLARSGESGSAFEQLQVLDTVACQAGAVNYARGLIHLGCDDIATACAAFDLAIDERYDRMLFLPIDALFDSLRTDLRFARLLRRLQPIGKVFAPVVHALDSAPRVIGT